MATVEFGVFETSGLVEMIGLGCFVSSVLLILLLLFLLLLFSFVKKDENKLKGGHGSHRGNI